VYCCDGSAHKIRIKKLIYSKKSDFQEIAIYDTYRYGKCLFLDGIIQSSEKDHIEFDQEIVSRLRSIDREILILGGGDGYTAEIALKINPKLNITIVECDCYVIYACKKYLGQNIYERNNVHVVIDDAIDFLNNNTSRRYDGIICDFTDTPIGFSDLKLFYSIIYKLAKKILNTNGWFTAYIGCNEEAVNNIVECNNGLNKYCTKTIESFGEPCFFLHGNNINK